MDRKDDPQDPPEREPGPRSGEPEPGGGSRPDDPGRDDPKAQGRDEAQPDESDVPEDEPEDAGEDADSEEEPGDDESDLPPPPDDGPLRVLPIRYLPLAEDDRERDPEHRPSTEPFRGAAQGDSGRRKWHWVPLGALVALLATTVTWFAAASLVPEAQQSLEAVAESARGVENEAERLEIWQDLLRGPQADAIQNLLIAMLVSTVAGLFLAGLVISFVGRAGALEAGLATTTFAVLSLVFLGGGIPVMALVGLAVAFGCGAAGGWVGGKLRRRRDARRRSEGLR